MSLKRCSCVFAMKKWGLGKIEAYKHLIRMYGERKIPGAKCSRVFG